MTLESCPETTVSFLQWNVPWILLLYAMCNETHLEYIMVEKIDTNFRIDLYGTHNAFHHDAGHTWGHGRSSQVMELTLREYSFELRILGLDRHSSFKFCRISSSAIFNFTRLLTAPRNDAVSPPPHVQPVPRADLLYNNHDTLVYDNNQMGSRHLCILRISNIVSWYYIRS